MKTITGNESDGRQYCEPDAARLEFDKFENWLYSQPAGLLDVRTIELGMEVRGREVFRKMLQIYIDGRGDGDVGDEIKVLVADNPGEFVRYTHKRMRSRKLVSIFGEVTVARMGYGMRGKSSLYPLDMQMALPARSFSYELQRRLVKKAVQSPFEEAVESIHETTGVVIPKRSAEQLVIDASVDFDAFYAHKRSNIACQEDHFLVGAIDCKGVPMIKKVPAAERVRRRKGEKANKKKMATVAAVFAKASFVRSPQEVVESLFKDKDKEKQTEGCCKEIKPQHKRVWASLTDGKDVFIADVRDEMQRRDPEGKRKWVIVTDGERALQRRAARQIENAELVLDLIHVLEKLWTAAHVLHAEGSDDAENFVRARALRILNADVSQVVKGLRQIATKRKLKGQNLKTFLGVANYFYNNKSKMRYNEYLEKGFPIASGTVEGACKNLIKDRMERSGMRWSYTMAEAMIKMRALYLSGDFEEYWNFHIAQEQQRLYHF